MSFTRINLDLESNNLLKELIDYTSLPYKLKESAKLWCISLRCMDTEKSVLLVPEELVDFQAPVIYKQYSYKDSPNDIIYKEYYNEDGTLAEETTRFIQEEKEYVVTTRVLTNGVKYNQIPKRPLNRNMLQNIFKNATEISGHNIVNFDLPLLRLFGMIDYQIGYPVLEGDDPEHPLKKTTLFGQDIVVTDTLIWSKLLSPDRIDRFGKHSIEAWGGRLGFPKIEFKEFDSWSWQMGFYGDNDTLVGTKLANYLEEEKSDWDHWNKAYSQELKLMDDMVLQEHFGFDFDLELAKECIVDLDNKLQQRAQEVEPHLPPKPLNKGETQFFTPPNKQLLKNNTPNSFIKRFAETHGATITEEPSPEDIDNMSYYFNYKDKKLKIPFTEPIENSLPTTIKDNNPVKKFLMDNGWVPTEWSERDLSRNSKKQILSPEKAEETARKYVVDSETSPYLNDRLEFLGVKSLDEMLELFLHHLATKQGRPLKVLTSPKLRVGTSKDLCPNLVAMAKKITFIKAISEYYTYKHRRNSISGTEEDEEGNPEKGFISFVREDGRVSTPADTMGANTFRYTHRQIANIARVSSLYGGPMRSLFGCGFNDYLIQLGFDFASLEARVLAHYVYTFTNGVDLGISFLAEKPNDVHCYSEDTEILTMSGWKRFSALKDKDKVCQWEEGLGFKFVLPEEIVDQPYKGKMYQIHDMIITPNHRMVLIGTNSENYILTPEELKKDVDYYYPKVVEGTIIATHFTLDDVTILDYEGSIGCVSVPTGKVFVKRNGTKFISGNTINANKLGISRDNAKAITYALMYGAAAPKLQKLLGLSPKEAEQMFDAYWEQVPALKELKDEIISFWENTGKDYIVGIDGRKLRARQAYSLINLLFQSAGAVLAKWSLVRISEHLQKQDLLGNPFENTEKDTKVWKMIAYHDEAQYAVSRSLVETVSFFDKNLHDKYQKEIEIWKQNGADKKTKPINPFEKAAEDFLESQKTKEPLEQFSDIGHTDSGVYYVSKPNVVSKAIVTAIDEVVKDNSLNVPLGMSWITGKNWKMCH